MKIDGFEIVSYRVGDRTIDLAMKELLTAKEIDTLIKYLKLEVEMLSETEIKDSVEHWILEMAKNTETP